MGSSKHHSFATSLNVLFMSWVYLYFKKVHSLYLKYISPSLTPLLFIYFGDKLYWSCFFFSFSLNGKIYQSKVHSCIDLIAYYMFLSISFNFDKLLLSLPFFCSQIIQWIFSLLLCDHLQWSQMLNNRPNDSSHSMLSSVRVFHLKSNVCWFICHFSVGNAETQRITTLNRISMDAFLLCQETRIEVLAQNKFNTRNTFTYHSPQIILETNQNNFIWYTLIYLY